MHRWECSPIENNFSQMKIKVKKNENKKRERKRNKAVYTTAPVAGGWAGAVMSWAGAEMIWAKA